MNARSIPEAAPWPQPLGSPLDHMWLVHRMAKATRTDLVAAWKDGALLPEDWALIVHNCRGCSWAGGCKVWLDAQDGGAARVPMTCVNHDRLESLRQDYTLPPERG